MTDNEDKESSPEEKFIDSIKNELIEVVLKNTIEYGVNKFKEKLPEWKEKYQIWKKKYFS